MYLELEDAILLKKYLSDEFILKALSDQFKKNQKQNKYK